MALYRQGAPTGDFDAGIEMALSGGPGESPVPVPRRARPGRRRRRRRLSGQRSRTGVAAVVLPLEQHSRTMSCWTLAIAGELRKPRRARAAGAADAGRPAVAGARRPTSPAQWLHLRNLDVDHAGPAAVPRLRRQPAPGVPPGDRAVRRERPARGPERARPAAGPTTRSSTSGSRSTTASRTSTAAASAASRSTTSSERGGLLRHGSILTVTSYATRTSPVIRGKWVLENLLGTPPPPPPPDVPALKDNTVDGSLPIRERLAEHRSNAACARCHNLIDPVGFVAGEVRRRRALADARRRRAGRRGRRAARRQRVRRRRRARGGAAAAAGAVRRAR